jgi:hypothetical protein
MNSLVTLSLNDAGTAPFVRYRHGWLVTNTWVVNYNIHNLSFICSFSRGVPYISVSVIQEIF